MYELLKFFGSWPAWTRGTDFPTRPPKFVWPQQEECPKDPHPFWPCPVQPHSEDELAGAAVRAVYLKQSLEAKNLVYYWMIGTAVRSEPDYLLEQLARESKPLTDRLARESTPQAVKCLKPDGTEEPCESRQTAQNQDRPPSIPQESCRQIDNCAPLEPALPPASFDKPVTVSLEERLSSSSYSTNIEDRRGEPNIYDQQNIPASWIEGMERDYLKRQRPRAYQVGREVNPREQPMADAGGPLNTLTTTPDSLSSAEKSSPASIE